MAAKKLDDGKTESRPQVSKFKDLARELETDDSQERFDNALRKIAKSPPPKDGKPEKDGR